jgi:hypothetical protein
MICPGRFPSGDQLMNGQANVEICGALLLCMVIAELFYPTHLII